jgi:hypothetical protein
MLEDEVSYAAAGAAARRSGHGGRIRRDVSAWIQSNSVGIRGGLDEQSRTRALVRVYIHNNTVSG